MAKSTFPKFKDMIRLVVTSGLDGDLGQMLEVAPTMKSITHSGKKYFRMDNCCQKCEDGTYAAVYLWDGYGKELMRRIDAGEPRDRSAVQGVPEIHQDAASGQDDSKDV